MGNRSSSTVPDLLPPIDVDAQLSSAARPASPNPLEIDVAARMAVKRSSLSASTVRPTPPSLNLPSHRPTTALTLDISTARTTPSTSSSPHASSPSHPPPLPPTTFASLVERTLASQNPHPPTSPSPIRRKSLTSHRNRIAPEDLLSHPSQRHHQSYRRRSLESSPVPSPHLSPAGSPKSSLRPSPIDSPEISVRSGRINPLHVMALQSTEPSPIPSLASTPKGALPRRGAQGEYSSFLDKWDLSVLCDPSAEVLLELWLHYQSMHPHLELLPFTALNGISRDLTLRLLAYHRELGRDVGGEEGREAVLPGWSHATLDASVVCMMKEVGRRMGTRIDRKTWERKWGKMVYGVLTRKEREEERKQKLRMKMARGERRRSRVPEKGSQLRCNIM